MTYYEEIVLEKKKIKDLRKQIKLLKKRIKQLRKDYLLNYAK